MPYANTYRLAVFAAFLVFATRGAIADWRLEGQVVAISDGDTLTLLDRDKRKRKIRLSGIDAPEKGQAFGTRSKEALSSLVFDRPVEARCHKRDRFGREVCKVSHGPTDIGLEQIRAGMAWWYREYAAEQQPTDRFEYARSEDNARAARAGLWRDPNPVAPWEFRRREKAARVSQ